MGDVNFVVIESPYAGDVDGNLAYLRRCMADAFKRGEVPFASHGLYTQPGVLNDGDPAQREQGIEAGFAVAKALWTARMAAMAARLVMGDRLLVTRVFYLDRGWSSGMEKALVHANSLGMKIELRRLDGGGR